MAKTQKGSGQPRRNSGGGNPPENPPAQGADHNPPAQGAAQGQHQAQGADARPAQGAEPQRQAQVAAPARAESASPGAQRARQENTPEQQRTAAAANAAAAAAVAPTVAQPRVTLKQPQHSTGELLAAMQKLQSTLEKTLKEATDSLKSDVKDIRRAQDELAEGQARLESRVKGLEDASVPNVPVVGLHEEGDYLAAATAGWAAELNELERLVSENEDDMRALLHDLGAMTEQLRDSLMLRPSVPGTSERPGNTFGPLDHPSFPWREYVAWRTRVLRAYIAETKRLRKEAVDRGETNLNDVRATVPQAPTATFGPIDEVETIDFPIPAYARAQGVKRPAPVSTQLLQPVPASSDVVVVDNAPQLAIAQTPPITTTPVCTCCTHPSHHTSSDKAPMAPVHNVHTPHDHEHDSKRAKIVFVQPAVLPLFSGVENSHIPDASLWVADIQEEAERLQEPLIKTLKRYTIGTAKDWVLQRIAAAESLTDGELIKQFDSIFASDKVAKRDLALEKLHLNHVVQGTLTVVQYFAKFHTLCVQAGLDTTVPNPHICLMFAGGLRPSLRRVCLTDRSTGYHFTELAKMVEHCKVQERRELDAKRSEHFKEAKGLATPVQEEPEGAVNMVGDDKRQGRGQMNRNDSRGKNQKTKSFRGSQEPAKGQGSQPGRGARGGWSNFKGGRGRGRGGPPQQQQPSADGLNAQAVQVIMRLKDVAEVVAKAFLADYKSKHACLFCGSMTHSIHSCPHNPRRGDF